MDENVPLERRDANYWSAEFQKIAFPGMDLMEVVFFRTVGIDYHEKQKLMLQMIPDFLKFVAENYAEDLETADVSESGVYLMQKGKVPPHFTVHLKYPLEYGGVVDFQHLCLMQDIPYHHRIHQFMARQFISPEKTFFKPRRLYVPTPPGKVYMPYLPSTSGGGGKAVSAAMMANMGNAGR